MSSPTARAPDRRQRKSRAALQQALLVLVAEMPYDEITIEEVTEAADVARATFYAHYKDKAALLDQAVRDLLTELTSRITELTPRDSTVYDGAAVAAVFQHAQEHRPLYRLIISGEGGAAARAELIATFEEASGRAFEKFSMRAHRAPAAMTNTAFVGALLLTLETWLSDEHPEAPVAIALQFLRSRVLRPAGARQL
jgi:AcrR family transcriptional regulator